jgi:hypothetical protein
VEVAVTVLPEAIEGRRVGGADGVGEGACEVVPNLGAVQTELGSELSSTGGTVSGGHSPIRVDASKASSNIAVALLEFFAAKFCRYRAKFRDGCVGR